MAVARHGTGVGGVLRALASQVHPVFMLPPLAASWFGGVLAGSVAPVSGSVHATAIFAAVYTAHVKDGYVDFHVRGEDDDHPLTRRGCRLALVVATALFVVTVGVLALLAGPLPAALTVPTWLIAYGHAPTLDVHPVGATAGYPAGIALAILGGYATRTGHVGVVAIGFAAVFLVLLSGVKVIDDGQDHKYDRGVAKRTVAVVIGPARSRGVAFGLMGLGLSLVVGLAAIGLAPPTAALATLPFGVVAIAARRADPAVATMLLVRGSYLFLAVLVAAAWYRPLS